MFDSEKYRDLHIELVSGRNWAGESDQYRDVFLTPFSKNFVSEKFEYSPGLFLTIWRAGKTSIAFAKMIIIYERGKKKNPQHSFLSAKKVEISLKMNSKCVLSLAEIKVLRYENIL